MPNYKIGIDVDADTGSSAKDIKGVKKETDDLAKALKDGADDIDVFGISLSTITSPMGLVTAGVTALGVALIATGAQAMQLATEVEQSTANMTTQLGLTNSEAAGFEETMRSIYTNNYGESFDDIAASIVAVEQQFGRIGGTESQAQLQRVTEMAIAFGDAFESDVSESTSAAVTLMENFGLTAEQAFDFLVAGQQRGLNASGDFLDTIGEYSVQFGQGKATAEEFFSLLETGMAGGVLGTDKAADAFKEFNIRIMDDSELTKTALAGIGISYDELKQGFANNSITVAGAMQTVIDKINEIEDPIERNKAGVALFGTQWEDLTDTMVTEIDLQKTKLEELEGQAASLEEQYKTSGEAGAAAIREWNNALVDVGTELNSVNALLAEIFAPTLEYVIIPAVKVFAQWLQDVVGLIKNMSDFLMWLGTIGTPTTPEAGASSVPVAGASSVPVMAPVMAAAGAGGGGTQILQQFYIERGDPEVVSSAAELGISHAQRSRGL